LCVGAALLALASVVNLAAQSPEVATLEAGRAFTTRLQLEQKADEALFEAVTYARVNALLQTVVDQGQQPSATPEDWKNLHRAIDGMTELAIWKGETFKAAVYQSLQNNFYSNLDGDYAKALIAARRELALQEQSNVTGTLYLPHSAVGRNLSALGRPDEALVELKLAHQLDPDATAGMGAMIWRDLIQGEIAVGKIAEAEAEVASMERAELHAGGLSRARAALARADVDLAQGAYDKAVDAVVEVQALVTDDAEKPQMGIDAVYELMVCILDSLDHAPYQAAIELSVRIASKVHGLPINIPAFARQAVLARRRIGGDLDGVLREYSDDLTELRLINDVPGQIETLRAIGVTYAALHARTQRVAVLEEARVLESMQLPESGIPATYPAAYSLLTTLNSLGDAYNELEDDRAGATFTQSLKVAGAISSAADKKRLEGLASEARIGLARADEINLDPDSARDIFEAETKLHPTSPWVALAWARLERNAHEQPAKASELYAGAVSRFAEQDLRQNESTVRLEYARFLASDGVAKVPDALAKAHAQVDAVAGTPVEMRDSEGEWQLAYTLGMIAEAEGHRPEAIAAYRDAVDKLDRLRSEIGDASRRQAFADSKLAQDLHARLIGLFAEQKSTADAWKYLEDEKARAFDDMLTGHHAPLQAGAGTVSTEEQQIRNQVVNLRADLTGVAVQAERGAGRSPEALKAQLRTLEARYAVVRDRALIAEGAPSTMASGKGFDSDGIRRMLPARTALLEYGLIPGKLAAFVVTRDGMKLRTWAIDSGGLGRDVLRLRRAMQSPASTTELEEATDELSKLVLAPVLADIPTDVTRLIIVPAGELHQTPFQALRLPGGDYLVDRFAISYLPSASALTALGQERTERGSLMLAAIGNVSVDGMPPLPGTLRETESIVALEPASKRITQGEFTHDAALQALDRYDEVHFATHGILDQDAPLFSALITSPAEGQPSRVSLLELTDRRIKSRLVVMSACETGLGRMSAGDEMTGLTRTFLAAGAKVVVSSLWSVSDDSTALLMQEFYRGLKSGKSSAEAMRTAEIEVRKKYPHPYYWAAFIVTGAI
jgi:CHAT domain-containing protein/tetratricopeptide (TPR) repeat protein